MQNAFIAAVALSLGVSASPASGAPAGIAALAPASVIAVGLQLRDGAPAVEPAPPASPKPALRGRQRSPASDAVPEPPPSRSPIDEAVDGAVRQQQLGAASRVSTGPARSGAPLTAPAKRVVEEIARAAGLDGAQVVGATNTVHDQAVFLVERLFDPRFGEAEVRSRYGTAGALAAESYRRMRDIYQVLDLSPEQRQAVVDVVANALLAGNAVGQVDNPDYEMVDVDPGPRADRARFERAIASHIAVARCLRPATAGAGERAYLLEIPRRGAWLGGATCRDAWAAPAVAGRAVPSPSAASDAGDANPAAQPGVADRTSSGASGGTVEVAPLPVAGAPAEARVPAGSAPLPGDASAWKYIVTDGPQGPVVTVAPAR
jgi:hypothetical protein